MNEAFIRDLREARLARYERFLTREAAERLLAVEDAALDRYFIEGQPPTPPSS